MLGIFEQLEHVKATSRQREKLTLLRKYDSPTLRDVLFLAFSPTVSYGVGRITLDPNAPTDFRERPTYTEFIRLSNSLRARESSELPAQERVKLYALKFPRSLRGMVVDLFAGKLSIGCDADLINRAMPKTIPIFGVQVAREFNTGHMSYPAFVSANFPGMRCLVFVTMTGAKLLTQSGKPIESLPHLEEAFARLPLGVYDGKLLHKNGSFRDTINVALKSEPTTDSVNIQFHAFDFVQLDEWDSPVSKARGRFQKLDEIYDRYMKSLPSGGTVAWFVVKHDVVRSNTELARYHDSAVESGFDGTMIQFDRAYNPRRTYDLMKLKDIFHTTGRVIRTKPGAGKFKGMLGSLVCEDTITGAEFDCGTGYSNDERKLPPESWVGKLVAVSYQERLPNGAPRFPTFLRPCDDL